jgi:RNA polymerase sigma factor (sigma-70 family)
LRDALQAGREALSELLEQHRSYLFTIINEEIDSQLAGRHGKSDILQSALLDVLEHYQRATQGLLTAATSEDDFRRWLAEVCRNALRKQHRDEGRDKRDFRREQPLPERFDQQAGEPSPSSLCRRHERDELLGKAVSELPEADRLLLRLRVWHDWTWGALAELLDGRESDAGRMRVQRRLTGLLFELGENIPIKDLGS